MTNTQHTPGPWRIGDAGFTVFGPPNPGALPVTIAPTKSRANARLIAAAPELLAALQACLAVPNKNRPDYIWDNARAAILAHVVKEADGGRWWKAEAIPQDEYDEMEARLRAEAE